MRTTGTAGHNSPNHRVNRVANVGATRFRSSKPKNADQQQSPELIETGPIARAKALVPVNPPRHFGKTGQSGNKLSSNKPSAPLVAQLIATHLELPQTRNRRRTGFANASNAYVSTIANRAAETLGTHSVMQA